MNRFIRFFKRDLVPSDSEYSLFSVKSILEEASILLVIMLILKNMSIDNSIDNFISVLGFMFLNEFIISSICFFNLNKLNIYPKAQNNH